MSERYDLVVLGSGPAGQKAAIQAAKLGASAVVVERRESVGGVCANTGTIPSKTLREAAIYLTGLSERGLYGQSYRVKDEMTIDDLIWRTQQVMRARSTSSATSSPATTCACSPGTAGSPTRTRSRSLTSMATRGSWRPAAS